MNGRCTKRDFSVRDAKRGSPQKQKLVALICSVGVWFSFNLGQSLEAAQRDLSIGAVQAGPEAVTGPFLEAANAEIAGPLLATGSELALAVLAITAVALGGYNLLSHGKQGWGWAILCIFASVVAFIGKLGIAMFCEVSSKNEIADWDE